jgi:hypothetical protein
VAELDLTYATPPPQVLISRNSLATDRDAPLVVYEYYLCGHSHNQIVGVRGSNSEVGVTANSKRRSCTAIVSRCVADNQAIIHKSVADDQIYLVTPAGLWSDTGFEGHCALVREIINPLEQRVANKSVNRIGLARLREFQLLGLAGRNPAPIANPIRPRRQRNAGTQRWCLRGIPLNKPKLTHLKGDQRGAGGVDECSNFGPIRILSPQLNHDFQYSTPNTNPQGDRKVYSDD